jgi:hypothetical protein
MPTDRLAFVLEPTGDPGRTTPSLFIVKYPLDFSRQQSV